jgi:hypothetical protein
MKEKNVKKAIWVSEFDADFESVEKVAKKLMRKNCYQQKSKRKVEFLVFVTVFKVFHL